ncbi:MAG: hypothetical protein AB1491_06735 [Thermodesulfobacteriota bacterium]
MDLIYLDYNCFQRSFDEPRRIRIQMEALACQEIFLRAQASEIILVWSFMHEDETIICPFPERKYEVFRLATLCRTRLGPEEEIHHRAKLFQKNGKLSAKDAVHLACADFINANYFLTCDDKLIKKATRLKLEIKIMNPVDYLRHG